VGQKYLRESYFRAMAGQKYLKKFISRKEAELNSIEMAFEILEEDLKPIEFEKL